MSYAGRCCKILLYDFYPTLTSTALILSLRYEPLDVETAERLSIELCGPCYSCYPAEEEDEMPYFHHRADSYQSPTPPNAMSVTAGWGGSEAPIV